MNKKIYLFTFYLSILLLFYIFNYSNKKSQEEINKSEEKKRLNEKNKDNNNNSIINLQYDNKSEYKSIKSQLLRRVIKRKLADIYHANKNNSNKCKFVSNNNRCIPSKEIADEIILLLSDLIAIEPSASLITEGLDALPIVNCKVNKYSSVLTGDKKDKVSRVFFLSPFSFEYDLAEIKLYEYDGIMDYFVILESGYTQRGKRRPLRFLDMIDRYAKFIDKIVYFNQDDSTVLPHKHKFGYNENKREEKWDIENGMRNVLIDRFKQLKDYFKYDENDLFVMGDFDEFPDRELLMHLKYCKTRSELDGIIELTRKEHFYRYDLMHLGCSWDKQGVLFGTKFINSRGYLRSNTGNSKIKRIDTNSYQFSTIGGWETLLYKKMGVVEGGELPVSLRSLVIGTEYDDDDDNYQVNKNNTFNFFWDKAGHSNYVSKVNNDNNKDYPSIIRINKERYVSLFKLDWRK